MRSKSPRQPPVCRRGGPLNTKTSLPPMMRELLQEVSQDQMSRDRILWIRIRRKEVDTDVRREEDLKERRHEIIYTLHIAALWMLNCPYIEYSLESLELAFEAHEMLNPLRRFKLIKRKVGVCSGNVYPNLVPNCLVKTLFLIECLFDASLILVALGLKRINT